MDSSWLALYIAYSIVWAGAFGFLFYLFIKQRRIDGDIKALKEALSRHDK